MPETVERKPGEFVVGDKVKMKPENYYASMAGTGVIVKVNTSGYGDSYYTIDFYPWKGGANCGVLTGDHRNSGYNLYGRDLLMVEPDAPPVEKAFFLVRPLPGGGIKDGVEPIPGEEFDDGRAASDRAKILTLELGTRVQTRRRVLATSGDWKDREATRMADGTYTPLPQAWDLEPIPDHFLHLSTTKKGFVAYTPDANHGYQDRQLSTRPGAYVAKFYPHLNAKDVGRYSAIVSCEGQLHFVDTAEGFKEVYENGPESCMQTSFSSLPCHPVEVYAAGDLALAYLQDDDDRIISRCIVWPEKKLFTRAYGDIEKIVTQLEAAGYERGNFHGARLKLVKHREHYVVCPYIDECSSKQGDPESLSVTCKDGYLVINDEGNGINANAHGIGLISFSGYDADDYDDSTQYCPACEDREDADGFGSVIVNEARRRRDWCEGCRYNSTFYCEGLGETVADHIESHETYDGDYWSSIYVQSIGAIECQNSNMMYAPADIQTVIVGEDGTTESWGRHAVDDHAFRCAASGLLYSDIAFESIERDGRLYVTINLPVVEEEESEDDVNLPMAARAAA